jgi:hypothetical protein
VLTDLERVGRQNHYTVNRRRRMPDPAVEHEIGSLLATLNL